MPASVIFVCGPRSFRPTRPSCGTAGSGGAGGGAVRARGDRSTLVTASVAAASTRTGKAAARAASMKAFLLIIAPPPPGRKAITRRDQVERRARCAGRACLGRGVLGGVRVLFRGGE